MSYHVIRKSILNEAVPTDGIMYYVGSGRWSNQYDSRKIFDTEESARGELTVTQSGGISYLPKGTQFVSE